MEAVYVVAGVQTFSIEFNEDRPGTRIENSRNYRVLKAMLDSFRVQQLR